MAKFTAASSSCPTGVVVVVAVVVDDLFPKPAHFFQNIGKLAVLFEELAVHLVELAFLLRKAAALLCHQLCLVVCPFLLVAQLLGLDCQLGLALCERLAKAQIACPQLLELLGETRVGCCYMHTWLLHSSQDGGGRC